jgi:hypothetical protein
MFTTLLSRYGLGLLCLVLVVLAQVPYDPSPFDIVGAINGYAHSAASLGPRYSQTIA